MEQELEKRIIKITKVGVDIMKEQTGFEISLTEDDMKQYLQQVINEVSRNK